MLCASYALVQATVGVGTVIILYIGVAYTKGGGYFEILGAPRGIMVTPSGGFDY